MTMLLSALLGTVVIMFIPSLIVAFWKKHPVWAFAVASLIMFVTLFVFVASPLWLVTALEDTKEPMFSEEVIVYAFRAAIMPMIICVPLLWLFQWFILRRHRGKNPKLDADKTFS